MTYYSFRRNQEKFENIQAAAVLALENLTGKGAFDTINPYQYIVNFFTDRTGDYPLEREAVIDLIQNSQNEDDVRDYLREYFDYEISQEFNKLFNEHYAALEILQMDDSEREEAYTDVLDEAENEVMDSYNDYEILEFFRCYKVNGYPDIKNALNSDEFDERYNMLLMVDKIHFDKEEVKEKFEEVLQGSTLWNDWTSIEEVLTNPDEYFKPVKEFLGI